MVQVSGFDFKRIVPVGARHVLQMTIQIGQLVNQAQPVIEHGFGSITPGIVQ
jgi:hypothetical protein